MTNFSKEQKNFEGNLKTYPKILVKLFRKFWAKFVEMLKRVVTNLKKVKKKFGTSEKTFKEVNVQLWLKLC